MDDISESFDRVFEGVRVWKSICLPPILYGSEVIPIDPKTISKLEAIQDDVAIRITGNSLYRVRRSIAKWELGLLPIRYQIDTRKLLYWVKLKFNPDLTSSQVLEDPFTYGLG